MSVVGHQPSAFDYRNSVEASRKIVSSILYYVLCRWMHYFHNS